MKFELRPYSASEPCRSRFSLREEGEVALPESPNGLGATAEFQLRGEVSTTKSPAIPGNVIET
jgi:hypothetical protein